MPVFDAIVVGCGGIGSATLYELAKSGVRVLGLDRFPAAHDKGSSHGESRIIRRSYFEHPGYVDLLTTAYELWDAFCERTGKSLFHRTGLLYFGDSTGPVIGGVKQSSQLYNIDVEELTPVAAERRFPGYHRPENATILFERDAGFLFVEQCVATHIDEAVKLGASFRPGESVRSFSVEGRNVVVQTDKNQYEAARLVIAAGSWASSLLADLSIPLRIVRKHLHWFDVDDRRLRRDAGCPCFFYETMGGYFYGFPDLSGHGLKVAEHSCGTEITDPLTDDRSEEEPDTQRIREFLQTYIPGVSSRRLRHDVCFYTMTPDEHFVIDRHPHHEQIVFAAGLSGHGFKFATVLGKILRELTQSGRSSHDIEFLQLGRPTLRSLRRDLPT